MRKYLAIALLTISPIATADETDTLMKAMSDYLACGQQYANNDRAPTVDKARSLCASKLDAYGMAMHALALAAQLAEGQPQDKAQAFATSAAAEVRAHALTSFSTTVQLLIELRN